MTKRENPSIGYKRPPRATQFKPGQSGNPKGRPKGTKNFATVIQNELGTRIIVTENGKQKTITKRQAVAKQLVNKAVAGDLKATPVLLKTAISAEESEIGDGTRQDFSYLPDDELVIANIVQRIRQMEDLRCPTFDKVPAASDAAELAPESNPNRPNPDGDTRS